MSRALLYALAASAVLCASAYAQDEGSFTAFLKPDSAECVSVAAVEKVAATTKALKTPTFRFVQARFVAIPPISHHLPPGDRAELVIDEGGRVMAMLIDGDVSCARFLLPDFLTALVQKVDNGDFEHSGGGL